MFKIIDFGLILFSLVYLGVVLWVVLNMFIVLLRLVLGVILMFFIIVVNVLEI